MASHLPGKASDGDIGRPSGAPQGGAARYLEAMPTAVPRASASRLSALLPRAVLPLVGLVFACMLGACRASSGEQGADESARFRNVADTSVAFAGDRACASCHEDLWASYQSHGMARSLVRMTDSSAMGEDFAAPDVVHAATGMSYRAVRTDDGRFVQVETQTDASGAVVHRLEREMTFVVGGGGAARSYLSQVGTRLVQLPLTWYAQKERWDMSPGYAADNVRFDRVVNDRCLVCHTAYPTPVPRTNDQFTAVPEGIGCERCHGPGALHVEARLADAEAPDSIDWTIVNPKHLSLARRLDVCQQCHLQGTVMLVREGQTPYTFRPGQAFEAHQALFSTVAASGSEGGPIGVISHAERMQQSACFLETQATPRPMECTTCHNPHEGFREAGPAYFNRTCQTCHSPADLLAAVAPAARADHAPAANCVACHMPKVASEVPHSSFTDHRIRVVKAQAAPPDEAPTGGAVELAAYFPRDRGEGGDAAIYRAMAYVVYGRQRGDAAALARGEQALAAALDGDAAAHGEAHFLLGFARLQQGRAADAIGALETSVRLAPDVPERLNALAQAYEAAGRAGEAGPRYQEALRLQPALASVRVNYGRLLEAQGRLAEAAAEYRMATDAFPWLATARYNLGTVLARLGDMAGGEAQLREAVLLSPGDALARGNLGTIYAGTGRAALARGEFEAAVRAAPQNAAALGNLGAFFLNENDIARAESLLTRAVDADPRAADALVNLALALAKQGRLAEAAQRAQQALAVRPGDPRATALLQMMAGQ